MLAASAVLSSSVNTDVLASSPLAMDNEKDTHDYTEEALI